MIPHPCSKMALMVRDIKPIYFFNQLVMIKFPYRIIKLIAKQMATLGFKSGKVRHTLKYFDNWPFFSPVSSGLFILIRKSLLIIPRVENDKAAAIDLTK